MVRLRNQITVIENIMLNFQKHAWLYALCLSITITACQKEDPASPDNIISDKSEVILTADGNSVDYSFTTKSSWSIEINDADWCSVSPESSDNTDARVRISAKANPYFNDRIATMTITCRKTVREVRIIQQKKPELKINISYPKSLGHFIFNNFSKSWDKADDESPEQLKTGSSFTLFVEGSDKKYEYGTADDGNGGTSLVKKNSRMVTEENDRVFAVYTPDAGDVINAEKKLLSITRGSDENHCFNNGIIYGNAVVSSNSLMLNMNHLFSYLKLVVPSEIFEKNNEWGITCSPQALPLGKMEFDLSTEEFAVAQSYRSSIMKELGTESGSDYIFYFPVIPTDKEVVFRIFDVNDTNDSYYVKSPAEGIAQNTVMEFNLSELIDSEKESSGYRSKDYSRDGEMVVIQSGKAKYPIDLVLIGDGFVDKDMEPGGKYEQVMRKYAEEFFEIEPYKSLRDCFNVTMVKAVSESSCWEEGYRHAIDENSNAAFKYSSIVNSRCPQRVIVIYNTSGYVDRSYCAMWTDNSFIAFIMANSARLIQHEAGGHGMAHLGDEYIEPGNEKLQIPQEEIDRMQEYQNYGFYLNVDCTSNPEDILWSHMISDPAYSSEEAGIYEGAFCYGHGAYRSTRESIMNDHSQTYSYNAVSRELIYRTVKTLAEGPDWVYDYTEFVSFDAKNRNSSTKSVVGAPEYSEKGRHLPPLIIKGSWRDAR